MRQRPVLCTLQVSPISAELAVCVLSFLPGWGGTDTLPSGCSGSSPVGKAVSAKRACVLLGPTPKIIVWPQWKVTSDSAVGYSTGSIRRNSPATHMMVSALLQAATLHQSQGQPSLLAQDVLLLSPTWIKWFPSPPGWVKQEGH